jgi:arginine/ornithine transport system ATP-binding protein
MSTSPIKLQALDIHKRYGANEVLKGVSLTAHAGDVISIIGSSAGQHAAALHQPAGAPAAGRILVAARSWPCVRA